MVIVKQICNDKVLMTYHIEQIPSSMDELKCLLRKLNEDLTSDIHLFIEPEYITELTLIDDVKKHHTLFLRHR